MFVKSRESFANYFFNGKKIGQEFDKNLKNLKESFKQISRIKLQNRKQVKMAWAGSDKTKVKTCKQNCTNNLILNYLASKRKKVGKKSKSVKVKVASKIMQKISYISDVTSKKRK